MKRIKALMTLLTLFVCCAFASGNVDGDDIQSYLSKQKGMHIVSRELKGPKIPILYHGFYEGDNGNPRYEKILNNKESRAIVDSIDYKIKRMALVKDTLCVFDGSQVFYYSLETGELLKVFKDKERSWPFYWEQAELFVYSGDSFIDGEEQEVFNIYNAEDYTLKDVVLADSLNEKNGSVGFPDENWVGYSESKIITRRALRYDQSLLLYDVFSRQEQVILDLKLICDGSNAIANLRMVSDTVIEFVIIDDEWFVCRFDMKEAGVIPE